MPVFLNLITRTSPIFLVGVFCIKRKVNKITNFLPKPWTNPFGKIEIQRFFNQCFHSPERLVFSLKRQKSFLYDQFSLSVTWGYRGLQGVTRCYRGLQGITRGYRGLQGPTAGYR